MKDFDSMILSTEDTMRVIDVGGVKLTLLGVDLLQVVKGPEVQRSKGPKMKTTVR